MIKDNLLYVAKCRPADLGYDIKSGSTYKGFLASFLITFKEIDNGVYMSYISIDNLSERSGVTRKSICQFLNYLNYNKVITTAVTFPESGKRYAQHNYTWNGFNRELLNYSDWLKLPQEDRNAPKKIDNKFCERSIKCDLQKFTKLTEDRLDRLSHGVVTYSEQDFHKHIESLWSEGMSWDNYNLWNIDHIISIAQFKENHIYDISIINNLANLKPLWSSENLLKSSKPVPYLQFVEYITSTKSVPVVNEPVRK